jgi:hypothetical protein
MFVANVCIFCLHNDVLVNFLRKFHEIFFFTEKFIQAKNFAGLQFDYFKKNLVDYAKKGTFPFISFEVLYIFRSGQQDAGGGEKEQRGEAVPVPHRGGEAGGGRPCPPVSLHLNSRSSASLLREPLTLCDAVLLSNR